MQFGLFFTALFLLFFLVSTLLSITKAYKVMLSKLVSLPLAFLATYLFGKTGLYSFLAPKVADIGMRIGFVKKLLTPSADAELLYRGYVSAVVTSFFFVLAFFVFYLILSLVLKILVREFIYKTRKSEKEESEKWYSMVISGVVGAVKGILFLAVCLTPITFLFSTVSSISANADDESFDDSSVYRAVSVIDKEIISAYNESGIIKFYDKIGLSKLTVASVKDSANYKTVLGKEANAKDEIDSLLKNSVGAVVNLQSENGSFDKVDECLDEIKNDEVMVGIIADYVESESKSYISSGKGIFLDKGKIKNEVLKVILDSGCNFYANNGKAVIEGDIDTLINIVEILTRNGYMRGFITQGKVTDTFRLVVKDADIFDRALDEAVNLGSLNVLAEGFFNYEVKSLINTMGLDNKDDVLMNKIDDAVDFSTWIQSEKKSDIHKIMNAVTTLLDAYDEINNSQKNGVDKEYAYLTQLSKIGEALDLIKEASITKEVPEIIINSLLTNNTFKKIFDEETIAELVDTVNNNDKVTYKSFMGSVEGLIMLFYDDINDIGGKLK